MKTKQRQIKFLERREVERLIAKIPRKEERDLRDRALLSVLFSTGMRISEALALQSDEMIPLLDEEGTSEFPIIGKGGWQRVVYFSPQAKEAVGAFLLEKKVSNSLFPITARTAQIMIQKRAIEAGIDKRVTPHMLRHSLATDLLRRGVDIAFVSRFLGHRSINNTMIYAHIVSPQLKSIHERLYGE